jgi:WD40 repeat protein
MSANYSSVQIRMDDRETVMRVIEEISRKQKQKLLVGPALGGWIGVYPKWCDYTKLCRAIVRRLNAELFSLVIKYDDVFLYEYYRDGKRVDRYSSYPDYESDPGPQEREKLCGRPDRFAHLVNNAESFDLLKSALANPKDEQFTFAGALLHLFANTLGIANTLTCYEYLIDGEEAAVDGWSQFEHFPDLREENARKRKADDALQNRKRGLMSGGLLISEIGGLKGYDKPWPRCCPASDGDGIFVVSSNHASFEAQPALLERYGPPWSVGATKTSLLIEASVYCLALSPSGQYLAVGHAAGDWKATLYDLSRSKRIVELPQVRAVSWVGFTPDDATMISISSDHQEGRIAFTPVDGSETVTVSLAGVSVGSGHPAGEKLVATDGGPRLVVLDIPTHRLERDLVLGDRTSPPFEGVNRILFDPTGDRIFLGTTKGVRVYHWDDVLRSKVRMPSSLMSFDTPPYVMETPSSNMARPGDVHALAYDSESQRLLFAGGDGRVRILEIRDGRSHVLLEPLESGPILALDFTRDRSTLAISCRPGLGQSIANPRGLAIQFWNYAALVLANASAI